MKNIKVFLNPAAGTKSHSRPIYREQARTAGLQIEDLDVQSDEWKTMTELYTRLESFVSHQSSKLIESKDEAFFMPAPTGDPGGNK